MRAMRGLAAIIAVFVVLAGCSGGNANHAGTPSTPPTTSVTAATAASPQQSTPVVETTAPSASPVASPVASAPSEAPPAEASPKAESPAPSEPTRSADKPTARSADKRAAETSAQPSEPAAQRITLSIVGNEEWGTIVDSEQVDLKDGDNASTVLKRVAKAHRLAYEIRGGGEMTYIEGIDGLYEFDNGPTSGWTFRVNGVVPDIGAGAYELKPGDRLEWIYVNSDELAASGEESAP